MSRGTKPVLTVVVPAYNEEDNLPEVYKRVTRAIDNLAVELELLIIDDGSTDGTLNWLHNVAQEDIRVRFISFSRNFGHQAGVTAGLEHATGDAVVIIDADLQDPPEVLPDMIQRWQEGYQIVLGQRIQREGDPLAKRLLAWGYYRVLTRLSTIKIPVDSGDFCLMDRVVVDTLNSLPERNRYVRGLRAWTGFKRTIQPFHRQARFKGEPKYNFVKSLGLAMDGLVSFSYLPLRVATYVGLASGVLALIMVILVLYWRFFTSAPLVGYAIIVTTFLFIGSIQLLTIGIMGEYIGRIYDEVKKRPHYIIKEASYELKAPTT